MRYIESKGILSKLRGKDSLFGLTYNMNIYRGCQHGCIYCDTRSECYGIGDISQIAVKQNSIELLKKELASKRKTKGTIGTGSMNDPYMPVEKKLQMLRQALTVIADSKYPVHIITKGDLVMRDYDLLQQISKTYAAVSFTITCADDDLAQRIEPHAPPSSRRFEAMRYLSQKGIYVGVTMMPLLPGINDKAANIRQIVNMAHNAGASYILPMFGFTMRKGSREYLYQQLDQLFPSVRAEYEAMYGDNYVCSSPHNRQLYDAFTSCISTTAMSKSMRFYQPEADSQLSLF